MPIPLGGLSYASLKLGPLGRRRRLAAVRDLAREAGENARVRVWDQETGEYRVVKAETAEAMLAAAESHRNDPPPDHPVPADLDPVDDLDDDDGPHAAAGPI